MPSFKSFITPFKIITPPVDPSTVLLIYKPLMAKYNLKVIVEGKIKTTSIPSLIQTLFLAWLIELFKFDQEWKGG